MSYFSSKLSYAELIFRCFQIFLSPLISSLAWVVLRIISLQYKISIYILVPYRPGFASTYLAMMEPLCRELEHQKQAKHLKILINSGQEINQTLTDSYSPNFSIYLDDRRKFLRLLAYLIPGWGIDKKVITPNNKFNSSWEKPPSSLHSFERKYAPEDLRKLGINPQNFVLLAHPSIKYYQKQEVPWDNVSFKFVNLGTYAVPLKSLLDQGVKILRIGADVDVLPSELNSTEIIDYSTTLRDEISELWLYQNCRFLISIGGNGAWWFAKRFNRPSICTDTYVFYHGYMTTKFVPKLIRNGTSDRFLTFSEMFQLRKNTDWPEYMRKNNFNFVSNSVPSLGNAINELSTSLDHKFYVDESDRSLQREFSKISDFHGYKNIEGGSRISTSFLREYSHLLE